MKLLARERESRGSREQYKARSKLHQKDRNELSLPSSTDEAPQGSVTWKDRRACARMNFLSTPKCVD